MNGAGFRWDDGLVGAARRIAELNHTPMRVLAGPGTGKTFALMRRVTRLLQDGATANRMLVCTFTRTAARDLQGELARLNVDGADEVQAGTLHSFCFGLLRREEVLEATARVPRPLLGGDEKYEVRFLLEDLRGEGFTGVEGCKGRLRAFNAAWARLQSDNPGWPQDSADKSFHGELLGWLRFHEAMLIGACRRKIRTASMMRAGHADRPRYTGRMKTFKPYNPDQLFLLPPALRDWLPEGHLALFISDVVEALNLTPIVVAYEEGDGRGQPPYHPAMMVKLLVYAYCMGQPSSRQIERATYEEIPYRILAANQHPDHDSLAAFLQRHLAALAGLFAQVFQLCQRAGLVRLGHVALDGTKILANASKHKAMSYGRMVEAEQTLQQEVAALLAQAAAVDAAEDAQQGQGRCGDELPAELAHRKSRLAKIREAKAALEAEATAQAVQAAAAAQAKLTERAQRARETGRNPTGGPPTVPDPTTATPRPQAQRNFTDPESRIMKDGATKSFVQAYNAQAAVDSQAQIIVAAAITPSRPTIKRNWCRCCSPWRPICPERRCRSRRMRATSVPHR